VNITILAWGGNGDVLPMLALAKGLRRAGHAVAFAAPVRHRRAAEDLGCCFFAVGPDPDRMLEAPGMQSSLRSTSGIGALRTIGRLARIMVDGWMSGCLPAVEGADAIVGGFVPGFLIGTSLSEKSGAPFLPAFLIPLTPTRFEPTFALFLVRTLGPVLNRLTHIGTLHLIWKMLLPAVNRCRREELGLAPAGRGGWFLDHIQHGKPVLYGYSRHVVPVPADWDTCNRVTGYWFPDPTPDFRPPRDLERFLESGPPPVAVGFGSMTGRESGEWMRISLDALRKCGRRGILLTGTAPVPDIPSGADVFTADFLPHAWLYGRAAAAVHHGGAGTTGAALRAGIPAVTVPHNFDQPFWGKRVARLGAGPPPILRRRLTADRLAAAIDRALTDVDMRRRAAALGRLIRAENGTAEAVSVVDEFFHGGKK
jgi:sterol 3beta-glucosyltransferase